MLRVSGAEHGRQGGVSQRWMDGLQEMSGLSQSLSLLLDIVSSSAAGRPDSRPHIISHLSARQSVSPSVRVWPSSTLPSIVHLDAGRSHHADGTPDGTVSERRTHARSVALTAGSNLTARLTSCQLLSTAPTRRHAATAAGRAFYTAVLHRRRALNPRPFPPRPAARSTEYFYNKKDL